MANNNPTTTPVVANPAAPVVGAFRTAPVTGDLLSFLEDMNGQDAYNATGAARGALSRAHFLKLPIGHGIVEVPISEVGVFADSTVFPHSLTAQIYALNKAAFGTDERAMKIALIRVYMVRCGWLSGTYEVEEVAPLPDAIAIMSTDLPTIRRFDDSARRLALLLPLAAEHTFRTMGHHYISAMGVEYSAKYQRFFNACVMPELTNFLPAEDLFHTVAHWTSLARALAVAKSPARNSLLPDAVKVRSTSAPAGTALVATTAAVLEAMDGAGLATALEEASGVSIAEIETVVEAIKADPAKFHTIPSAYGSTAPTASEAAAFVSVKSTCARIAPVIQGFLDALPSGSSLSAAKALAKHADVNPMLRKKAKVFFKEIGVTKAANMAELFSVDKRARAAAAVETVEEEE
jgi:hypothetical protein